MTVVQVFVADTHYKSIPKSSELPSEVLDILCKGIAVNSSYATNITVSDNNIDDGNNITNCCNFLN
jgi:Ca2+ transporting ATPase